MSDRDRDRAPAVSACLPLAQTRALAVDAGKHGCLLGGSLSQRMFWFQVGDLLWRVVPDWPEGLNECNMGFCELHYESDQLCVDGSSGALCGYHSDSAYAPPIADYEYLPRKYGDWRTEGFCMFHASFGDESSIGAPAERCLSQLNACAGHVRYAYKCTEQSLSKRLVLEVWRGIATAARQIEFTLARRVHTHIPLEDFHDRLVIVDAYDSVWIINDDSYDRVSLYRRHHDKLETTVGGVWSSASEHLCTTTRVGTWRQCLVLWGQPEADSSWHVALIVPDDEFSSAKARVLFFTLVCPAGDVQEPPVLDNERGCLCAYTKQSDGARVISVFQLPAQ